MLRSSCLKVAALVLVVLALPGCGGNPRQWEVTVENKSEVPCSFFVTLGADSNSNAKVEDVAKGKAVSLIVGDSKTVVQSVKVVRGEDEQTFTPKTELAVGKRYTIVVGADGKVDTSVSDKRRMLRQLRTKNSSN
jgi:hypothetical protein